MGFELSTAKDARIERGYLEQVDEDEPLNRLFNNSPVFSQIKGPNQVNSNPNLRPSVNRSNSTACNKRTVCCVIPSAYKAKSSA